MHVRDQMASLRTAIPYIRAFKNRVFVVKLGGRLCEPGEALTNIVDQLSMLYQVGIRLVIVHGGGDQATALGHRLGVPPRIVNGRRITDDVTLEAVKMAFAGTINTDLVAAFRAVHVPVVGLSGVDAGLITATRRPPQPVRDADTGETVEVDFGHVGDITAISTSVLESLIASNYVPVIGSLAADESGRILNVNADTVAARIAVEMKAAKYFLVTTVDGVLRDVRNPSTLQTYLDLQTLNGLIEDGAVRGGMLPKVAACRDALLGGVQRVHIVNGLVPDTLLGEVFTNEGCGTLIVEKLRNGAGASSPTGTAGQ